MAAVEAAVVGPDTPERAELHRALLLSESPGLVVALASDGDDSPVPLLHGRSANPDGAPQVYLCKGMVCERPVAGVPGLLDRLAAMSGNDWKSGDWKSGD